MQAKIPADTGKLIIHDFIHLRPLAKNSHSFKHAMMFSIDPHLASDTMTIGDLPLCRVLLMNDARFPWLILTPRKAGVRELFELSEDERAQLIEEVILAERVLSAMGPCDKLNIGTLGNIVPQLHIHVVARRKDDAAWPGPVWGFGKAEKYAKEAAETMLASLRSSLDIGHV